MPLADSQLLLTGGGIRDRSCAWSLCETETHLDLEMMEEGCKCSYLLLHIAKELYLRQITCKLLHKVFSVIYSFV